MLLPTQITSSCIWVVIPVDLVILDWYACGADGWSGGRAYSDVIPLNHELWHGHYQNFVGWVDHQIFVPTVPCCARFERVELR